MKKRSSYRPRIMPSTPILFRFTSEDERNLQLTPHAELEKMRHGIADEAAVHTLACRLNLGHVLAERHFIEAEAKATMQRAIEAMLAVKGRFDQTGKVGATGDEFFALGDGLNLTDEMQEKCTRRELRDALLYVFKIAGR